MNNRDIVRHKLVTRVVEAYEQFEQKNKKLILPEKHNFSGSILLERSEKSVLRKV